MMAFLPPQFLQAIQGTNVSFADWVQQYASLIDTSGYGIAFQQGVENALPRLQPLAVTATGGMGVAIGGTSAAPQFVLTAGLLCGSISSSAFTVPANSSGSTRIDGIAIAALQVQVGTVSREVEDDTGTKTMQNIPLVIQGIAAQYVQGPNGGGEPTAPAGTAIFATISVPNGAGSISQGEITVQFPTMFGSGTPGPQGAPGTNGHGATTTTAAASMPAAGSSVTLDVTDAGAFAPFSYAVCADATDAFLGQVTASNPNSSPQTVTILCAQVLAGNPGDSIGAGAALTFGGPPGAAGHGVTSNVAIFTLPDVLGSVSFAVADVTAFLVGSWGYAIGPNSENAFAFVVTGISGNTLTVTLMHYLSPLAGGGLGTGFAANGIVVATTPSAPGCIAFLRFALAENISPGTSYTLDTSNNAPFPYGSMFIAYGMSGVGDIALFRVTAQHADGSQLTATALYANNGGAGLGQYSALAPCGAFSSVAAGVHSYAPTVGVIVNADVVDDPGVNGSQAITFKTAFSDANYIIVATPHDANYTANIPYASRTATGCTVTIAGTGHGQCDFVAIGY